MGPLTALADLLEYPDASLATKLRRCGGALPPPAAEALRAFEAEAARLGLPRLEQEYAAAFDMDAACALYAGHQLFGETPRRTVLLCRLAAEYREHAFAAPAGEPADSLPLILRYADGVPDTAADGDTRRELLTEIARPAARRLEQALTTRAHAYAPVLRALALTLEAAVPGDGTAAVPCEGATV